jgi:hypothetical protein
MKKPVFKIFIGIACIFIFANHVQAVKLIDYGFEDWVGFSGTTSPAPGYIYTSPTENTSGWTQHINSTIVTTGGTNCNNNTAHEGSYYQHVQTSTSNHDDCLGGTAQTTNVRNYIGVNYPYPNSGTHNTTHLGSVMTGDTAVIRFWFRVTDDWSSSANDVADGGGGLKFIRWAIGRDSVGDDNNILIKLRYDYGEEYPRIGIYDRGDNSVTYGSHNIDWQDGNWHAFGIKAVEDSPGTYTVSTYLDDWNMVTPMHTRVTTVPDAGNGNYYRVSLVANWSGVSNIPNLIGIDFDNIEVWDGIPGEVQGWENATFIDSSNNANNAHYNSGGRRIVRVGGATFALSLDGNSDYLYKSTDDGDSWSQIDNEYGYSGSLISGDNNYIYHFSRFGGNVRMVKFLYDAESIPAPVNIAIDGGTTHGAYRQINATVNQHGDLFVFYHDDNGGSFDTLYMIKSVDNGNSWEPRTVVRSGNSEHSWGYVHSDVTPSGNIVLTYSEWASKSIQFAISTDNGTSWTHTALATGDIYNPSILPGENNELYIFAQSNPDNGLVFKKSVDGGVSWTNNWTSIQANHANGYADPSPTLGNDGTIYVAFRGADSFTSASDDLREYIAMSVDGGDNWTFPFNNLSGGRVGTRSIMRYQTWHNYGGPLQWTWLEEVGEDTNNYPTAYSINKDVEIMQQVQTPIIIRADVDQNSSINSTDALLTLRNSLGLNMSSTNWQTSATTGDVNCDNTTNSIDALLILRNSLGLDMSGGGWCIIQ